MPRKKNTSKGKSKSASRSKPRSRRAKKADPPLWRRLVTWPARLDFGSPDLRRGAVGATWILMGGGLLLALILGVPQLRAYAAELAAAEASELKIDFIDAPRWVSEPPAWMKGNVHELLIAAATPELKRDPFDRESLIAATEALRRSGWFEEIEQVRRVSPDRIEVNGTFVQLFAVVRDSRGDHLVDQRGRLLPGTYGHGATTRIALTSPRYARPAQPGEQWEGTDITAGLELLKVVLTRPWAKQIASIDIGSYADDLTLVLVTDLSKPIIWGRSPGEGGSITELTTEGKLRMLDYRFEQYGRIDAGIRNALDVRGEVAIDH